MRIETKRKIIRIIGELINYYPTKDEGLTVPVSIKRIINVKCEQEYENDELTKISDHQVRFAAILDIISKADDMDCIEIERQPIDDKKTMVTADVKILKLWTDQG